MIRYIICPLCGETIYHSSEVMPVAKKGIRLHLDLIHQIPHSYGLEPFETEAEREKFEARIIQWSIKQTFESK